MSSKHSCNLCPTCGGNLMIIALPIYGSFIRSKFGCMKCGLKWEVGCQRSQDEELIAIYPVDLD